MLTMFKSILVQMTGTETDESALRTAFEIARKFDGHLECLRVRMDSGVMIRLTADAAMAPAGAIADTLKQLKGDDAERTENAQQTFEKFCALEGVTRTENPTVAAGVTAAWRACAGDEADRIAAKGRYHDLVVLARKSKAMVGLTPAELGAIVFTCGRPIVLAPVNPPKHVGQKIALAWKDTAEAARALTAAAPLLSRAPQLTVLSAGDESEDAMNCVECADSIAESLRWRGGHVDAKFLVPGGRRQSDTILDAAKAADADLLISGAYGHSRLRQIIFGGFTQRLLERTDLPVFLFH